MISSDLPHWYISAVSIKFPPSSTYLSSISCDCSSLHPGRPSWNKRFNTESVPGNDKHIYVFDLFTNVKRL